MRRPSPLPSDLAGRPFSIYEADSRGVSRKRTRAGDLVTPYRSVRDIPGRNGLVERCQAYAARMAPDQFFSHETAATLLGLPLPSRIAADKELHITSVSSRQSRARGVVGHLDRDGRTRVSQIRGLRVASPLDTWCTLASILDVRELVAMGDALVRRKEPSATLGHLAGAVYRHAGRRGATRLRLALDLVRPRTDSPKETDVRLTIVEAGLPEPEVNVRIVSATGAFLALGDLVYQQWRVLVEYDGDTHFVDPDQSFRDINRLDALMAEGWRVIRITKKHGRDQIARRVREALLTAGWTP